ncbi:MAG: hypothetical protein FP825_04970 [Hyphomonas sp.]|uniref:hypothetical protein n=1 Tax=Hyphomonas sp. TaxID=87 RepID=UPI0017DC9296|nr:hypothetical protein [Hyphomonas sp.]MBA3067819.1 hypothetical protein [Hyphomonas sp.]MBU3919887.1 hypothetical protein [Alphaproteobacteria bacterium]MBU4063895.1 hypothetical protein [Alphaproteobacteria bacterium]MBU4163307.1 hypothetical protein [Alphaproteobacteria bacterium]
MEWIGPAALATYMQADPVAGLAQGRPELAGAVLTSQRWLDESPAKRLIFQRLYADLLDRSGPASVLDVGGGLSALTPRLADGRRYVLADPLHHETEAGVSAVRAASGPFEIRRSDWHDVRLNESFDVMIANDLFPNVDQRLGPFLDWAIPLAREIRLSLTFHNLPRWYRVKRVDAEEHLTVLAADGARTVAMLAPFAGRIAGWAPELFDGAEASVFPNGRQVVLARIKGDA